MDQTPAAQTAAQVLESVSDAFFALDDHWRFTYLNAAAGRLLFRKREDLLGKKVWDEFPQAVGSTFDLEYRRAVAQNVTVEFEEFYPPLDTWFAVRAYPTPSGLAVYFQNVTDQRRAREQLRLTAERLSLALSAADLGDWSWDSDSDVLSLSPRAAEIFGVAPGVPFTRTAMRALLHDDDRERARVAAQTAFANRSDYDAEYRVNRADGRQIWVAARGRGQHDASGKLIGMLGVVQDITVRKLNEEVARDEIKVNDILQDIANTLARKLDLHDVLQTITDAATRLTRAQFGAFFHTVTDERGEALSLYTISGGVKEAFSSFPMPRNTAIFGPTFRGEGTIRLDDVNKDPRYGKNPPYHGRPAGHPPVSSYMAVSVRDRGGNVIGGLFFGHVEPGVFTRRDETVIEGVAGQAAIALENARLYEQVLRGREAAQRDLARSQAIISSMSEGLVVSDLSGNLLEWNRAALEMHGFENLEQVRKNIAEFPRIFELRDSQNRIIPLENWPILRALRGETFTGYEIKVLQKEPLIERIISYSGTPVRGADGSIELALITLHDVTDRRRAEVGLRESEERFRDLANSIPQLAWMARPDGWIFWYNQRWHEYTGTTPQQMEGWGWQSVHDPEQLPRIMQTWKGALAAGTPWEDTFPLRRHDGEFRWHLSRAMPFRDARGQVVLWFGTNTDITDEKIRAQERQQLLESERGAREEAERASRMKDEFLATLSHELRTPLNAILGWSQILLSGSRDEGDLQEGLRTIERNARSQTQIIEDLLDMSRIISGKIRLDVQPVDLPAVLEAAIDTVRPAAAAKEIRLQAVLDPLAAPIAGDPNRLQQVMWNLLTNAIKFTPKGGRVQVLLERVNSHLELSVIDTGQGIAPEFLPHVFDRFRQADSSSTRRHGGLGLGLAIVKQLVELHGGSVRARSAGADKGAAFTVILPITVIHPASEPPEERRHPKSIAFARDPEPCISLAGLRVLVVDDEPDARALVKRLLQNCAAQVTTAASAMEAMESLQRQAPDVLVSDIGMPVEDGHMLIRKVRGLPKGQGGDVPAIALTAYARSEDRRRAILAGYQMHISKPVEPAELVAMVASLARRT